MKTLHSYSFSLLAAILLLYITPIQGQNLLPTLDDNQNFNIGGFSSILMPQGKTEINWNNTLNSFWLGLYASPTNQTIRDRLRFTNFFSTLDAYHGFSKKAKWNLGIRLQYSARRIDNEAASSPFKIFSDEGADENVDFDKSYRGLTGYGIRLRFAPFENTPQFVINGGYTISNSKSEEYQKNLNTDRNVIDLNASYFLELNTNAFYYFSLNNTIFSASEVNKDWLFNSGAGFFLVHLFFNQKLVLYPGLSYNITYKSPDILDDFLIRTDETLLGSLGIQWQPSNQFSLNVSGGIPLFLNDYNLAVERIRNSYSQLSLGMRIVL